ncbi:AraC family transcriptional regulator [Nostocaceae cyanobacterium CENA357]|uniref:AraC family transcriptional regulator n=1 Tax=Atlanticothrix silvestris CENA357 TaxID=1725252 RepID=A0A8J7HFA9_9CYAN|nr:AraC family transcriptional regulator [Atlanticothrix silvestris CENA357]
MKEATFSVSIVRDIVQYAATYGVDAKSLCKAAGIEPALMEMPDQQITGAPLRDLWREAVKLTGDENFGLHLGEAFNVAAIGIVGYVLLNCNTFNQVLEKLSRYTHLFSQGVYINFSVFEGQVLCDCEIVDHLKNYLLEEPRHPIESTFAALITATKMLTGQQLYPHAIWFQHSQPNNISEHERIFRTGIRFKASTNRMILDVDCLNWPVLSANPSLLSLFEQHATAMLNELSQEDTHSKLVVQAISHHLKGEVPSLKTIAHSLAISVRNLQRELQTEGTSYQQLLDATRKELALRHLKTTDTPIHDVAFLLGFSEPSAFHRAFKRWTGKTPRAYQALQ